MTEPTIIVPINISPAGAGVPPGETVYYSTIVKVKSQVGGAVGFAMQADQHAAWAQYKTHLIITDKSVIYDALKQGIKYFSLTEAYMIKKDKLYISWARFKLVQDMRNSLEDKAQFKARVKRFASDILPLVIASLRNAIESAQSVGLTARQTRSLQRRLAKFEKQSAKII